MTLPDDVKADAIQAGRLAALAYVEITLDMEGGVTPSEVAEVAVIKAMPVIERATIERCIEAMEPLAARTRGVAYRQAVRDSQRALRALLPEGSA